MALSDILTDSLGSAGATGGLSQPTGLEALLAHPYFQAAAAGLFSALASPRQRGLSGALSAGGLGALNAFQQAERNKLQLPLLASQIQGQQAQTQSALATGGLRSAQTAALQGQLQGDAQSAHYMDTLAADPTQPTSVRQAYALLSPSVRSGKVAADKAFAAAQTGDLKAAQILLANTRTGLAQEQLKELPGLTATKEGALRTEAGAAAERANIAASLAPGEEAMHRASAALSTGRLAALPAGQMAKVNGQLRGFLTIPGNAPGMGVDRATVVKRATDYVAGQNPTVNPDQIRAVAESLVPGEGMIAGAYNRATGVTAPAASVTPGGGTSGLPAHAHTGEGLGPGWRPNGDGTWTGPDGTVVAPR